MKPLILFFLVFLKISVAAQDKSDKLFGRYYDHFGSELEINPDSTFKYSTHGPFFNLPGWNKGKWLRIHDTIYLKTIIVYDTLRYITPNGKHIDSLIKTDDEMPRVLTAPPDITVISISQDIEPAPEKLYYKEEKLFKIDGRGRLIKKKRMSHLDEQLFDPWYYKWNSKSK